jgi:hypothetical protein
MEFSLVTSPGLPRVSDGNFERVREAFQRSPLKSVAGASRELGMSINVGVEGVE